MTDDPQGEVEARPMRPADLAKAVAKRMLAAVRERAWKTRREKYGPKGHNMFGGPIT